MKNVHVALTVSDLGRSVNWYKRLFDAQTIFSGPDDVSELEILMLPGDLMLALRQHRGTAEGSVVMNGLVSDGYLEGAQVHEEGQLVNPNGTFQGTITILPATAS